MALTILQSGKDSVAVALCVDSSQRSLNHDPLQNPAKQNREVKHIIVLKCLYAYFI